jgi:hypothetical protein
MKTHDDGPFTCLGVSLAKVLIFSLTTEIPRSSDAFNSSTRARKRSGLRCVNQVSFLGSDGSGRDVPEELPCKSQNCT